MTPEQARLICEDLEIWERLQLLAQLKMGLPKLCSKTDIDDLIVAYNVLLDLSNGIYPEEVEAAIKKFESLDPKHRKNI